MIRRRQDEEGARCATVQAEGEDVLGIQRLL